MFASAISLCVATLNTQASDVIATAQLSGGVGTHAILNSLKLYISTGGPTNGGTAAIFDSFSFTAGQAGQVFSIDQGVDPQFNLFVSRLTNGVNDLITRTVQMGATAGLLIPESTFFSTRPPGGNGIDLKGFTIDRIDMTIDEISITSPGSNPTGDGIWTDGSVTATLSFIGSPIPEPCGGGLIVLALACASWARRSSGKTDQ